MDSSALRYPNQFPLDLLDVMREKPNVCKYLDIALQHISDHMLTRMHRHVTKQETLDLLTIIRNRVPGIHIRTTLMVGFPGETEEDFHELLDFVREQRSSAWVPLPILRRREPTVPRTMRMMFLPM